VSESIREIRPGVVIDPRSRQPAAGAGPEPGAAGPCGGKGEVTPGLAPAVAPRWLIVLLRALSAWPT
jgi:hypothetical protein